MPRYKKKSYSRKPKSKDKKQDKRIRKIENHIKTSELKSQPVERVQGATANFTGDKIYQLVPGTGNNDRLGDSAKPYYVDITLWAKNQDTNINNSWRFRWWVIRVNNTTGVPVPADIFLTIGTDYTLGKYREDTVKLPVKDKFITTGIEYDILYDSGAVLLQPNTTSTASSRQTQIWNKRIRFDKRKPVRWSGPLDTDGAQGQLLLCTSGEAAAVVFGYELLAYFTDP